MALLTDVLGRALGTESTIIILTALGVAIAVSVVVLNILSQLFFQDPRQPPLVFHWIPFFGNAAAFGSDPIKFYTECREKHGDLFTFILLGQKLTVYLGTQGNDFILNGKNAEINAEVIYRPLTEPVFGPGVVYDCPNSKLMEQKKFVKYGLTTAALESYVPILFKEIRDFMNESDVFADKDSGVFNATSTTAKLTILTASHCLQGVEVREKMSAHAADLFAALDKGFSPLNFVIPHWPIPQNINRDSARRELIAMFLEIIEKRRAALKENPSLTKSHDMIWELMQSEYKKEGLIPDQEIACMMIALLMAGQHSSAATSAWMLLRLSDDTHETSGERLADLLLKEQYKVLGKELRDPTLAELDLLPLHTWFIHETLRLHGSIHSVMRKVQSNLTAHNGKIIPKGNVLVSAIGFPARLDAHFPEPMVWNPLRWKKGHALHPRAATAADKANNDEEVDYGYGKVTKGTSSPYIPFGAGRHRCIGEPFAYVQLRVILVEFVRTMKLSNGSGNKGIVGTDYSSLFSHPFDHATIKFERRNPVKQ